MIIRLSSQKAVSIAYSAKGVCQVRRPCQLYSSVKSEGRVNCVLGNNSRQFSVTFGNLISAVKRYTGDWYKPQLFATGFECPLKRNKCEASLIQTDRYHSYQRLRCSSSARALRLWFLHTSSARCLGYTAGFLHTSIIIKLGRWSVISLMILPANILSVEISLLILLELK